MATGNIYRWKCPFESCNHEQSGILDDEDGAEAGFKAHLTKHNISQVTPFILKEANWLWSARIVGEQTGKRAEQKANDIGESDPSKPGKQDAR